MLAWQFMPLKCKDVHAMHRSHTLRRCVALEKKRQFLHFKIQMITLLRCNIRYVSGVNKKRSNLEGRAEGLHRHKLGAGTGFQVPS